jgi:hypothetical protein
VETTIAAEALAALALREATGIEAEIALPAA